MSLTIVSNADHNFYNLAKFTEQNKIDYCNKHKFDFIQTYYELPDSDMWYWHNIKCVVDHIESGKINTEWIMWTDSDTLIMNFDISILDIIKKADKEHLFIASQMIVPRQFIIKNILTDIIEWEHISGINLHTKIHTGNFLIRNVKESAELLKKVYVDYRFRTNRAKLLLDQLAWDEGALAIYLMSDPYFRKKWLFLDFDLFCTTQSDLPEFSSHKNYKNSTIVKPWKKGDFIVHAMGRSSSDISIEHRKQYDLEFYSKIIQK